MYHYPCSSILEGVCLCIHVCVNIVSMYYVCSPTDMGYAQGMNDLLARFLVVTDSEVDAYWMFERYMRDKRLDFMETSMMRKVGELPQYFFEHYTVLTIQYL